ncbi:adenosylcobinamide amidohydrolase [Paenibacillus beijingensis]|uniref:Adenosylcobinamide amidohydrolase n=1 Tax=Paenibacillus beijingensis TaxID=1126833 RepID=A0A0D5NMY4_9BACL|nr:adenosylcobinamide amidohydrolase [Paenibacillus beijingensis]AJY76659.1 hypothetical protein VN24_21395 [Paenibacillus beijingensis]
MSQPFRTAAEYRSKYIEGLVLAYSEERIVLESAMPLQTLGNAVFGGGLATVNRFVNWKVPRSYRGNDPNGDAAEAVRSWGFNPKRTSVLLTAAKLSHASVEETAGDRFSLLICTTAGTSNAARAGSVRTLFPAYGYMPGTINSFIYIDGALTQAAMINALMTAVEAKAAALQDAGIKDADTGLTATGTTSDAILLGVTGSSAYGAVHAYAGTATTIGGAVAEAVYRTVLEAVMTQHER